MQAPNIAPAGGQLRGADVDMPQGSGLDNFACYSRRLWAIVNVDQTQVVYPSERGPAQCTVLEKNRSRGCRALRSPFWRCAWLRSWPLVQSLSKKSFMWTSLPSPANLSTPANISKLQGRALWAHARPALFPPVKPQSAGYDRPSRHDFATADIAAYEGRLRNDKIWRSSCGQHLSLPLSFLPWLQPAQSLRQSLCRSKSHLRLSLHRPANTSDLTWRAGSYRPALSGPVPSARLDTVKVRPC